MADARAACWWRRPLRVDVEPVAHGERDRLGLRQHAARTLDQCRLLVRRAHRRLRQHAHRSGAEIERQLLPDQFADVGRDRHRQIGGAECRGERLDARRGAAVRFAEHRAAAGAGEQTHHARCRHRTGGPEDAADGALRSDAVHSASPGSRRGRRRPSSGPPCAWKYHHGMPFIGNATGVSGPSSGAMVAATAGSAGAFTVTITASCGPSSAGLSLAAVSR